MRRLTLEGIAGFLEVLRIDDSQEIVIQCTDLKPNANGTTRIVLSPRQARHLSSVLIAHSEEAERVGGHWNKDMKSR